MTADAHAARVELVAPRQEQRSASAKRIRRDTVERVAPPFSVGSTSTVSQRSPIAERAVDHVGQRRLVDCHSPDDRHVARHLVQVDVGGSRRATLPNRDATPPLTLARARCTRPPSAGPRSSTPPPGAAGPGPDSPACSTRSPPPTSTSSSCSPPTPTTSSPAHATRSAQGRAVVACGGDGTVSALAGVAADEGGVLGILPLGSGNDFARQLDIPRGDLDAAIDVLRTGRVVRADLGRAHTADGATTWFTTVANTGFDAVANAWANDVTWTSGTPLYVLATLRTLAAYSPTPVRVTVDDATHRDRSVAGRGGQHAAPTRAG